MKISIIRKIVQIVSFVLIMWGGLLIFGGLKANLPSVFVIVRAPADFKGMTFTKNAPPYNQPYNLYLPFKSCRYARETGLFRGCTFHLFQEMLSWKDPLRVWGPYFLVFLLLGTLLGRFTCGWVCPVGFLQDILSGIRGIFKIKRIRIGEKLAKRMRKISIGFVIFVLFFSWMVANKSYAWDFRDGFYLTGCQMCPTRIISSVLTGYPMLLDLWRPAFVAFFVISIFSVILVLGSLIVNRLWCRICPNGLFLSFFNKGKCLVKQKDVLKCARCGVCADVCSMETKEVYLQKSKPNIDHLECINCFRCIENCPEKALKVKFLGIRIF